MGRKPPAAVRAARVHRDETVAIDGLSAGAVREIRVIERSDLGAGTVGRAVAAWRRAVHRPLGPLLDDMNAACPCCDVGDQRDLLAVVMARLGRRARRELEAVIDPLDDLLIRRTHDDPAAPPEWPWWRRRI